MQVRFFFLQAQLKKYLIIKNLTTTLLLQVKGKKSLSIEKVATTLFLQVQGKKNQIIFPASQYLEVSLYALDEQEQSTEENTKKIMQGRKRKYLCDNYQLPRRS